MAAKRQLIPGMLVVTKASIYCEDMDDKFKLIKVDKGEAMMIVLNIDMLPAAKESIRDTYSQSPKTFFKFLWGERRISTVCSTSDFNKLFYVVSATTNNDEREDKT